MSEHFSWPARVTSPGVPVEETTVLSARGELCIFRLNRLNGGAGLLR